MANFYNAIMNSNKEFKSLNDLTFYETFVTDFKVGDTWFRTTDDKEEVTRKAYSIFTTDRDLLEDRLLEVAVSLDLDTSDEVITKALAEGKKSFTVDYLSEEDMNKLASLLEADLVSLAL